MVQGGLTARVCGNLVAMTNPRIPDLSGLGRVTMPDLSALIPVPPAKALYNRLEQQVKDFQDELKDGEAMQFIQTLAGGGVVNVQEIGYHGPDLMVLYGVDVQERRTTLLIHISQVALCLTAVPKDSPSAIRKIGFSGGKSENE
jgi:hypothetical protein